MKRILATILFCSTVTISNAQQKDNSLGIFANVGGFALVGPTIGVEGTLGGRFIIEGYYRAASLGAVMTSITDFPRAVEGTTKVDKGNGAGAAFKLYYPKGNGGWYAGVFADYMHLMYTYMYIDDWESGSRSPRWANMNGIGFGANAGYKYTFAFGVYLRAGLYVGGMKMGRTTYYDGGDNVVSTEKGAFYPYINPDISVGFRF